MTEYRPPGFSVDARFVNHEQFASLTPLKKLQHAFSFRNHQTGDALRRLAIRDALTLDVADPLRRGANGIQVVASIPDSVVSISQFRGSESFPYAISVLFPFQGNMVHVTDNRTAIAQGSMDRKVVDDLVENHAELRLEEPFEACNRAFVELILTDTHIKAVQEKNPHDHALGLSRNRLVLFYLKMQKQDTLASFVNSYTQAQKKYPHLADMLTVTPDTRALSDSVLRLWPAQELDAVRLFNPEQPANTVVDKNKPSYTTTFREAGFTQEQTILATFWSLFETRT